MSTTLHLNGGKTFEVQEKIDVIRTCFDGENVFHEFTLPEGEKVTINKNHVIMFEEIPVKEDKSILDLWG